MPIIDKLCDSYFDIATGIDVDESLPERYIFSNYVPMSYHFLDRLFTYFPFDPQDHLVDFGCGKGRVLFMAAHNSCKYVTGYEIDDTRYDELLKNIDHYQKKFGNDTMFSIDRDVQNIKLEDINDANKFFFFHPFHLKLYMKVIKNILTSVENNPRNISIYLYRPYNSTLEYLDRINTLHREVCIGQTFSTTKDKMIQTPQFILYSNFDMEHSLKEYSISL